MVVVGAQFVFGNVHAFDPQFAVVEVAVGVHQPGFPGPDGFDFGAGEHDAGGVFFQEFVVEGCSSVFYIDIVLHRS